MREQCLESVILAAAAIAPRRVRAAARRDRHRNQPRDAVRWSATTLLFHPVLNVTALGAAVLSSLLVALVGPALSPRSS